MIETYFQSNDIQLEYTKLGTNVRNYSERFPVYYPGYVFYKTAPRRTYLDEAFAMTFCNKFSKNQCRVLNPKDTGNKLDLSYVNPENPKKLPKFVQQMNETLFERIGGIVYYNFDKYTFGWLLFFNIDGRPKYCHSPQFRDLPEGVRHEKHLIPNYYSEHCFSASHRRI